jgi:D-alanyl-D-alanine dipeptidase
MLHLTRPLCVLIACASAAHGQNMLPANCRQCLVVTTSSWTAVRGDLVVLERAPASPWKRHATKKPVLVGKAGLAWGRGVFDTQTFPGSRKFEGDNKSPAGVFRLRSVFGYAAQNPGTKMLYLPLSQNIVAVDDPQSRYYNQLVNKSKVARPDWRSAEKMILRDNRYQWGVFVEHNVPPQGEAGSCIFLHVWKDPNTLTTGCTAMAGKNMLEMIRWLDPTQHPVLVQLPREEYDKLRAKWNLPEL